MPVKSFDLTKAPFAPNVIITFFAPFFIMTSAAASALSWSMIEMPEIASASVSFGVRSHMFSRSLSDNGSTGAGAGLTITFIPHSDPFMAAYSTVAIGISS